MGCFVSPQPSGCAIDARPMQPGALVAQPKSRSTPKTSWARGLVAGCIPLETSRWILLLSVCDSLALADSSAPAVWHETNGGRWCQASPTAGNGVGFTLLKNGDLGIAFTNHLSETAAVMNRILENGSGVALGDVDGDGRCDIYLCRMEGGNVLYRNMGGWKFVDITESAGVACAG